MFEAHSRLSRVFLQLAITVLAVPFLLPLVAMIKGSLSGAGWENYRAVLSTDELPIFFRNSLVIAVLTIVITYTCTICAAFALAKLNLRFKETLYYILLAALTLPAAVLIIPLFVTIEEFGLFNSYWAVVLPQAALGIPFCVLLARAYIEGIPDDLIHAAQIDGCGMVRILGLIIIPLAKPISAVIVVWALIGSWNDLLFPLLFLQDADKQTITLLPQFFQSEFGRDQPKIIAAATITAVPEIIAFLLLQRWFERGLTAGAVK